MSTLPPTTTAAEVAARLDSSQAPILIDVRPSHDFEREHIEGAHNATVYETVFLDTVAQIPGAADKSRMLVAYGVDAESLGSQVAAEKLLRSGYSSVLDLRGGLAEWRQFGGKTVEDPSAGKTAPEPVSGRFVLDEDSSRARWIGRNLLNHHEGELRLSSGQVTLEGGVPREGFVEFDMTQIRCLDLTDPDLNRALIRHLEDEDFFAVERYPKARIDLRRAEALPEATPGSPNLRITGVLDLRGRQNEVSFDAVSGTSPDGRWALQSSLQIDRTRWGVLYGSGKFFKDVAGHLVNDEIGLELKLHFAPEGGA